MKTIVENIIEKAQVLKDEHFNPEVKKAFESFIESIQNTELESEFEAVARTMMKHLGNGEKYHPHMTVIITNTSCELVEGVKGNYNVMDYVCD